MPKAETIEIEIDLAPSATKYVTSGTNQTRLKMRNGETTSIQRKVSGHEDYYKRGLIKIEQESAEPGEPGKIYLSFISDSEVIIKGASSKCPVEIKLNREIESRYGNESNI